MDFCVATSKLFKGNGIDISVAQFAEALAREHNVTLATEGSDMALAVEVVRYPVKNPTKLKAIARDMDRRRFDFISTHISPFDIVASLSRTPHILHDPGVPPWKLIRGVPDLYLWSAVNACRLLSAGKAAVVMPISSYLGGEFRSKYLYRGPMSVLPYGIRFPEHEPAVGEPLEGLGKYILFVGKHRPYKGIRRLIEIFKAVKREAGEKVSLVTIGMGESADYMRALGSLAKAVGDVYMLGYVRDIWPYYAGAAAFATCSAWEGQDRPAIEAQYMGKPIVAFDNCSHPEVVLHGTLARDDDEFKGALARYLSEDCTDPSVREKIVERFSLKSMVKGFLGAVKDL